MIIAILTVAMILRLILLNQSFWLDEAISALTAMKPFPFQLTGLGGDFQPPLYYLLLHIYMKIPFYAEWFLRLPSVIFAVLTVYVLYRFCEDMFDKKTALLSSLLLAVSQFHIYYSQELRMYSLLCLLSLVSLWALYKKKWIFLGMSYVLGLYTSYMFFTVISGHFVWMIYLYYFQKDKKNLKNWLLTAFFSLLIFLPWMPVFLQQLETGKRLVTDIPLWSETTSLPFWKLIPQIFIKFSFGRISLENKIVYGGLFAVLSILYGYIFSRFRKWKDKKNLFIINSFITPMILSILISFIVPITGVWRFIFLLPSFLILLALSIRSTKYPEMVVGLLIAISMTGNIFYWIFPGYQRENWRDAVKYTQQEGYPAVFTVENGFAPYQWYGKKDLPVCTLSSLDKCRNFPKIYYYSYLEDFFDSGKKTQRTIEERGFINTGIKDFSGVGLVYTYENRN